MKTILVTGGAGYIGPFTVKELLDQDYEVVVLDSLENGHKEAVDPRAKLEVVDLKDRDRVVEVFDRHNIEAVIDFAAYLAVGESMEEPEKYLHNNVDNYVQLLDVMVEKGCQYIIKSSTASTYGNPEDKYFPLKEDYQDQIKLEESALLPGKWHGATPGAKGSLGYARDDSTESMDVVGEEFFQKIIAYYQEKYANRPELLFTDNEIAKLRIPASVYGLTKLMDEILMAKYAQLHGIKAVALRYFNVSGAAEDGSMGEDKPKPTTLMTLCFWNILGRTPELSVFGNDYPTKDGTGIRDYIHPLDLATGHRAALEWLMKHPSTSPQPSPQSGEGVVAVPSPTNVGEGKGEGTFEVFNLGAGQGYSVFEVMKAIEEASGKKITYVIKPRRSGDPAVSYADPGKAESVLGWQAKYDLHEMARTAWLWHSTHQKGYEGKQ